MTYVNSFFQVTSSFVFDFIRLKYIKKRSSSPPEYNQHQFEDVHIHRIPPIISVSDVVTSMKQSLEELGAAVVPKRSQPDLSA